MSKKKTGDDKAEEKKSFWLTVPGILTGIAAIITAVGALITALGPKIVQLTPSPQPNPITITLVNEHCFAQDFYVDQELKATVAVESGTDFTIDAGSCKAQACKTGTQECGDIFGPNWTTSTLRD